MAHEYEISQLRQKIQIKEKDVDRLKRLIENSQKMISHIQHISTDCLDTESDVWRDFTTNQARSAHATLDSEKGIISNNVENGLQQAYDAIGELQSTISNYEYEISALKQLDSAEE